MSQFNRNRRRGFVSTILVLAVMLALSMIGMICTQTLLAERRSIEQATVDSQLELLIVAAKQWSDAKAGSISEELTIVTFPAAAIPPAALPAVGPTLSYQVELQRDQQRIVGRVILARNNKLIGSRQFAF